MKLSRYYVLKIHCIHPDAVAGKVVQPREGRVLLQAFGFANANAARDGAEMTGFPHGPVLQGPEHDEMVLAIAEDEAVGHVRQSDVNFRMGLRSG